MEPTEYKNIHKVNPSQAISKDKHQLYKAANWKANVRQKIKEEWEVKERAWGSH